MSVKRYGKGCVEINDDEGADDTKNSCSTKEGCPTPDMRCKKKSGDLGYNKTKEMLYLRISCWTFNTVKDFEALDLVFGNNLKLSTSTNNSIKHQFLHTFDLYERLFSVLDPKAFFIRAERLRHHLIFYYAHTAVFYINKLVISKYLSPLDR